MGYLESKAILEIVKNFELIDRAQVWRDPDQYDTNVTGLQKETISTLDFGVIGYGNNQFNVYTFDKTGDAIRLEVIEDIAPYLTLTDRIRERVFNDRKPRCES